MPSPSDLVSGAFAQAQTYATDAQTKLASFTNALNAAVQVAPLVDITFSPIPDPGAATVAPYVPPAGYTSSLWDLLKSTITTRLAGGTGLAPAVETAIWDRARERELATAQAAIDQVQRDTEALGFVLPPGVLYDAMRREQRAYYDKSAALSREVAIKQADLEQTNAQKSIDQGSSLEQVLAEINYKISETALNAYRGEVDRFRAEVDQDTKRWEVAIKQYEAEINYTFNSQKLNTEVVRANLATALEAAKTGAQVYAQLAASAYSLIHANASVQGSSSTTVGYNYNNQTVDQPPALTSI